MSSKILWLINLLVLIVMFLPIAANIEKATSELPKNEEEDRIMLSNDSEPRTKQTPQFTTSFSPLIEPTIPPSITKLDPIVIMTPIVPIKPPVGSLKAMICDVFTGRLCSEALLIAFKESSYHYNVVNSINCIGLFQICARWHARRVNGDVESLKDPVTNIRIARQIYDEHGKSWRAWETCKFLPQCY